MTTDPNKPADAADDPLDPANADDEAVRRLAEEQEAAGDVKPTPGA